MILSRVKAKMQTNWDKDFDAISALISRQSGINGQISEVYCSPDLIEWPFCALARSDHYQFQGQMPSRGMNLDYFQARTGLHFLNHARSRCKTKKWLHWIPYLNLSAWMEYADTLKSVFSKCGLVWTLDQWLKKTLATWEQSTQK